MPEWQTRKVGSLLSSDRGISVGVMYPGENIDGGVPLIRVGDLVAGRISPRPTFLISPEVHREYRRTELMGGECLITLVGRPGMAAVVPAEMVGWNVARALAVLRLADPNDARFLTYALATPEVQNTIRNWCNTTVQATLNLKEIKQLPVPWPEAQQRGRIVAALAALDDKVELNRRMNETLEAMARAIFQDWFVTFGPSRAKMEGRPPYLAPDLWSLFPDRLDAEGKPEGWVPRQLSSLAALERKTVSPASVPDELFDHYSIPAFDAGQTPVREFGSGILSNKTLVPHGAVLLSKLNPEIPRVWLIDADPEVRSICSTEFLVLSPIVEPNRAFLFFVVTDAGFRQRLQAQVTGTSKSHQRVKPQSVLDARIITAAPNVMGAFQQQAGPLLGRILANQRESRTLAATRDLLLPRLMSGELRVKEAERIIEAAV
jgi:type I restriction enzyme S subunit